VARPCIGTCAHSRGRAAGLAIGKIELEDGRFVFGVLAEPLTVKGMREITSFGGWRRYMDEKES